MYADAEAGAALARAEAGLGFLARGLSGAPTGRRAGPWGVGTYSYCLEEVAPEVASEDGLVEGFGSLTTVFRSEPPVGADPDAAGPFASELFASGPLASEPFVSEAVEGFTAMAGFDTAAAASGWAVPRPSEYPKPKKTPQTTTEPKKTPSSDFMPSVISVSVPSFSSSSTIVLISA